MNKRFFSALCIFLVILVLLWHTIRTLREGFQTNFPSGLRILAQLTGWGEIIVALFLFTLLFTLLKKIHDIS